MDEKDYTPKIFKTSRGFQFRYTPTKWAERPAPIEGELLSSWMIRTVLTNLIDIKDIYFLLKENKIQFKKIDYYISSEERIKNLNLDQSIEKYDKIFSKVDYIWFPELMEFFSKHTGFPESQLKALHITNIRKQFDEAIQKLYSNQEFFRKFWEARIVFSLITPLRICPKCLKEDKIPYIRKIWQMIFIPICLSHKSFFIVRCPKCRLKITPHRIKEGLNIRYCYNCKLDLGNVIPRGVGWDKNNYLKRICDFFEDLRNIFEKIAQIFIEIWKDDDDNTKFFYLPIYSSYPFSKDKVLFNLIGRAIERIEQNKDIN